MKFAFSLPHMVRIKAMTQPWETKVTGADQTHMIKRAEELGYDMVNVPEHFLIPREHIELSGPHYFDATSAQGYVLGATKHIRVGSSITILPFHNPIVLAKALATLDWLSGGRIFIVCAVGWLEPEFKLMGVPFHERGAIADEYLAAMVELWTKEWPRFSGKYVAFQDAAFEPKPVQKPHVPIWMGGDADAALKRTARFASGWIPHLTKPENIPARIDFIKSQPTFKGGPFEVLYGMGTSRVGEGHVVVDDPNARAGQSAQQIVDRLGWLKRQGVTVSSVPIPQVSGTEEYLDYAQWVIEEIKPKVQ